jgi:hypothetical protein
VGTPIATALSKKLTLSFERTKFVHRWSKAGQHEFTPAGQEDLKR